MPNIKSATKRMVLSRKANAVNRSRRSELKTTIKKVRAATDPEEAKALLSSAYSLLDRAARTRLLHPNKVARVKSQLTRHVDSLSG